MERQAVASVILIISFLIWLWRYDSQKDEVSVWLKENDLGEFRNHPNLKAMQGLRDCAALAQDAAKWKPSSGKEERLVKALQALEVRFWLQDRGLGEVFQMVTSANLSSLKDLMDLSASELEKVVASESLRPKLSAAIEEAKRSYQKPVRSVAAALRENLYRVLLLLMMLAGVVLGVRWLIVRFNKIRAASRRTRVGSHRTSPPSPPPDVGPGILDRMFGKYLNHAQCTLEWSHDDGAEVGTPTILTVQLVCRNSTPYALQSTDKIQCTVTHASSFNTIPTVIEPTPYIGHSTITISFTVKISGQYTVEPFVNGCGIGSGSYKRNYVPGPVDSTKTDLVGHQHTLVLTKGIYYPMRIAPKDSFGNKAVIVPEHLCVEARKDSSEGKLINTECVVDKVEDTSYEVLLKIEMEGHYVARVLYREQNIGPGFTVICLTEEDAKIVERNLSKKNINLYYEATLMQDKRAKKVYCYISPRQIQIKEFYMRLIPLRVFTCKVCPSTKVVLHAEKDCFTLDDSYQQPLTLYSQHRELISATFYGFLLKNIGGSEKFQDKQNYFYQEVKKLHNKQSRSEQKVVVTRSNLLESAMTATRNFGVSEWCKKFMVEFVDEEGRDCGGVSREFFELISVECFNAANGLFRKFSDNTQALVHPNPSHRRPPNLKLKHFEFAGRVVGKCLYESAVSGTMPLLIKARFTRSFLAQIIGLRIHYKYFESDDPDLYTSKVQYILDNDVTYLGLVFAEEEFKQDGVNPTVVPLIDHGSEIDVVEQNKVNYLNLLAQYRLAKTVREETESFLKGLNDIIPDNLLSIFDENELELLMCGVQKISYDDLKQHARVMVLREGDSVVSWFWTVVRGFTEEEMAKLLQFVTGCSQLPPGGFKDLSPPFTIVGVPTHNKLPTAHTCFNQLCLPSYDSCHQFQTAIMLAINEGVEGFGLL